MVERAVLISIQPYYVFLIIAKAMGWDIPQEKTIEVRKTIPRDKYWNRKAIIYCSKNKKSFAKIPRKYQPLMESFLGKVIGEFVCDGILSRCEMANADIAEQQGCIKREDLIRYACGKELYGWHIADLKIYDKPKELNEFKKINRDCWYADLGLAKRDCPECKNKNCFVQRPPQSWCYVERLVGEQ